MKNSKSKINLIFMMVLMIVLSIYTISLLFPLCWGVMTSLKSGMDFHALGNILGFPDKEWSSEALRFANYKALFADINLYRQVDFYVGDKAITHWSFNTIGTMTLNSILYAGVGALLTTFVTLCMAYLCSKYKFVAAKIIYMSVIITMTVPLVGTYSATISLLRTLNLFDSFLGYFLQKFHYGGMYFLVFYAFFESMSDTYCEAAEIDGASQLRVMVSIMLPLAVTIFSTVTLINFIALWNDFQTPLLYMPTKPTLAFGIYYFTIGSGTSEGIFGQEGDPMKIALCMLLAVPVLVLFIVLRNKIMGNVTIGGIK